MKKTILFFLLCYPLTLMAQKNVMTPELLWSLGRVSALGASPDGSLLLYKVDKTDLKTEKVHSEFFLSDLKKEQTAKTDILKDKEFVQWDRNGLFAKEGNKLIKSVDQGKSWTAVSGRFKDAENIRVSPDGLWAAFSKPVLVEKVLARDMYDDLDSSTAHIYTDLAYRHWDKWSNGKKPHVFLVSLNNPRTPVRDIMEGQPYACPQEPFGGKEDFIFSLDSKAILYVCKKKTGKEYAQSTNTDIYVYDIGEGKTTNRTEGMMGYDLAPQFSPDGKSLSWLSMKTDGYEADKMNLIVLDLASGVKTNLTENWDETIDGSYAWSKDGKNIYFTASVKGTQQLFSLNIPGTKSKKTISVKQCTKGDFDLTDIIAQSGKNLIIARMDFNHAKELFSVNPQTGALKAVSHANDEAYAAIKMSKSELRMVTTKDGHQMGVWVIYPPDFDSTKKYPTLLYCEGGPQSALSQFYSLRWNFQLMAANGYIIVAPNRRGMPGWGVAWNASISKDWGGKPMQDYLDAIDNLSKEPFVDTSRLGCVGASYGGYSVYMLAGIHNNRFKTFIAHDGLFDMKSWYGTTEELWFANWDLGGNYWQKPQPEAYIKFNPSNYVDKWNTPIMIIQGGIDYRVPIEQGLEAFQAAQLRGIKSELFYCPDENHWVLHPHNGLAWQREFFKWLKETLN